MLYAMLFSRWQPPLLLIFVTKACLFSRRCLFRHRYFTPLFIYCYAIFHCHCSVTHETDCFSLAFLFFSSERCHFCCCRQPQPQIFTLSQRFFREPLSRFFEPPSYRASISPPPVISHWCHIYRIFLFIPAIIALPFNGLYFPQLHFRD